MSAAQVDVSTCCDFCDGTDDVSWFCEDCEEVLCGKCSADHTRGKKRRNHQIVPLKKEPPQLCSSHNDRLSTGYCDSCDLLLCDECKVSAHRNHKLQSLDSAKSSKRDLLKEKTEGLKNLLVKYQMFLRSLEQIHSNFDTEVEKMKAEVKVHVKKIHEEIDVVADGIIDELDQLRMEENRDYYLKGKKIPGKYLQASQGLADLSSEDISNMDLTTLRKNCEDAEKILGKLGTCIDEGLPEIPVFIPSSLPENKYKGVIGEIQSKKKGIKSTEHQEPIHNQTRKYSDSSASSTRTRRSVTIRKLSTTEDVHIVQTITVLNKAEFINIRPYKDDLLWVTQFCDNRVSLINDRGEVVQVTKEIEQYMNDFIITDQGDVYFTAYVCPLLRKFTPSKVIQTIADFSPYHPTGLYKLEDSSMLVCLTTTGEPGRIVQLSTTGTVVKEFKPNAQSKFQFGKPFRITCLRNGEMVIKDSEKGIIFLHQGGIHLRTWNYEVDGKKVSNFKPYGLARDKDDHVFTVDYNNGMVCMLTGYGKEARCLIKDKDGPTKPCIVAIDQRTGCLLVGCKGGKILKLKY